MTFNLNFIWLHTHPNTYNDSVKINWIWSNLTLCVLYLRKFTSFCSRQSCFFLLSNFLTWKIHNKFGELRHALHYPPEALERISITLSIQKLRLHYLESEVKRKISVHEKHVTLNQNCAKPKRKWLHLMKGKYQEECAKGILFHKQKSSKKKKNKMENEGFSQILCKPNTLK